MVTVTIDESIECCDILTPAMIESLQLEIESQREQIEKLQGSLFDLNSELELKENQHKEKE